MMAKGDPKADPYGEIPSEKTLIRWFHFADQPSLFSAIPAHEWPTALGHTDSCPNECLRCCILFALDAGSE